MQVTSVKELIPLPTTGIQINASMAVHHMVVMDWVWNDSCAGFSTVIISEKFAYIQDFWIDANLKLIILIDESFIRLELLFCPVTIME